MDASDLGHHTADLAGLSIHYVEAGTPDTDAVVLLHGWPESWYAWRHVIPRLAGDYRVIAPDLRGFGESARPATGYDMASLAGDIHALLDHLQVERAHVVGHDFGAATGYTLAATWPERVRSLTIVDMIVPGFGLEDAVRFASDGWGLWHLPFHAVPEVPEMLIAGHEHEYLSWFFRNHSHDPAAVRPEDVEVYAATLRQPGGARASFGVYRDLHTSAMQNRALAARGKLAMPVLALGGDKSIGPGVGASMKALAADVEAGVAQACGHWMAEERPDWLAGRLSTFFRRVADSGA